VKRAINAAKHDTKSLETLQDTSLSSEPERSILDTTLSTMPVTETPEIERSGSTVPDKSGTVLGSRGLPDRSDILLSTIYITGGLTAWA